MSIAGRRQRVWLGEKPLWRESRSGRVLEKELVAREVRRHEAY